MKKFATFLVIFLLGFTLLSNTESVTVNKTIVSCTATKENGTKVKLLIVDGRRMIAYFDAQGNQGETYSTDMDNKRFSVWSSSRGYIADC